MNIPAQVTVIYNPKKISTFYINYFPIVYLDF
jgi:hypothetical protein